MHEKGTAMTNTKLQEWSDKQQENQDAINAATEKLRRELDAAFKAMRANLKVRAALDAFAQTECAAAQFARGNLPFIPN